MDSATYKRTKKEEIYILRELQLVFTINISSINGDPGKTILENGIHLSMEAKKYVLSRRIDDKWQENYMANRKISYFTVWVTDLEHVGYMIFEM